MGAKSSKQSGKSRAQPDFSEEAREMKDSTAKFLNEAERSGERHLEMEIDSEPATAAARLDDMCRQLLANGVIEDYRFEIGEKSDEQ